MLGFWLYMLAVDLLIPATMIGFGLLFLKRPPKKINAIFGYRSMRSMQNEDTWRFAHQHCGKVWCTAGLIMAPLSAIAVAFLYGLSTTALGFSAAAFACCNASPCSFRFSRPNVL